MAEVWKAVPAWPYEVSSLGRIRRTDPGASTRPGRVVKAQDQPSNYYAQVRLSRGSRSETRTFRVHRLVALAFLGAPPAGLVVNHINGDKRDNRAENLEYITQAENLKQARSRK